jgi:hypothetical protein
MRSKHPSQNISATEADQAMQWLHQAVVAGYKDVNHIKQDHDLDILRPRPDFQQLLADLERKQSNSNP